MGEKRISKLEETARDGAFKEQYGSEWFVKIKPAFGTEGKGIDKVIFSFVRIGSEGKKFFDVYMDIDVFDNWADDIIDGTFKKVIIAEGNAGEQYPKEYRHVTGKDGEKSVGFMLSRSGTPLINASVREAGKKAVYANVPLSFGWLRSVAKSFKRTSAPRFIELDAIMMEAANSYSHDSGQSDECTESLLDMPDEQTRYSYNANKDCTQALFKGEVFWCKAKGSVIETRKDVLAIRAVVPRISEDETDGILPTDPAWQLAEIVFYPKNVERSGFTDQFNEICSKCGKTEGGYKLPAMECTVGDVRNGFRQLIFQRAM